MSVANELSIADAEMEERVRKNPNVAMWVDMAANWLKAL